MTGAAHVRRLPADRDNWNDIGRAPGFFPTARSHMVHTRQS